jgi:uncharacterized lipoprotein YmbA
MKRWMCLLLATLLLAACGGGDDGLPVLGDPRVRPADGIDYLGYRCAASPGE